MSTVQTTNTLQQDLFLLAKNHYDLKGKRQRDAAKIICAHHVLSAEKYFSYQDVAFWLLKEFAETKIILGSMEKISKFLIDFGRYQNLVDPESKGKIDYHRTLVDELLSLVALTRVREGSRNLMPFEIPQADPEIQKLLDEHLTEAE